MAEVVAALIWREGRFLIAQRPDGKKRALLWEFVGGKVETGETLPEALIRECREELGITVDVGEEYMDVTHEYPDITVHMTLFHCTIAAGEPQLLEHKALTWITPDEIPQYDFCPADEAILARLRADAIRPGRYRHFKGNEYELVAVARHSETLAPMVVYRALYGDGGYWVRPAEMWLETVERDGQTFPRFQYIEQENKEA